MTRDIPAWGKYLAATAGRLALVALVATTLAACGDDDKDNNGAAPTATAVAATRTPTRTVTPTVTPPNSNARVACAKLLGCKQCMTDTYGQCLSDDACAQRLGADSAICINGTGGCNATALGDCLFLGCQGNDATGDCQ